MLFLHLIQGITMILSKHWEEEQEWLGKAVKARLSFLNLKISIKFQLIK